MKSKKVFRVLACFLLAGILFVPAFKVEAKGIGKATRNFHNNDYSYYWQAVPNSYIYFDGSNPVRVEATNDNTVIVEKYSSDFSSIVFSKEIPFELPIFGGFYCGSNNLYVMYGQENLQDSDSVEVVRVVKYDYSWNRKGSTSFKAINTYIPFDAGSSSFVEYGNTLYILTCHEMYKSSDGKHHQASMMLAIDTLTMQPISDWNINSGYCSHSFNQFIKMNGSNFVILNHGDAYPRSIELGVMERYEGTRWSGEHYNTLSYITEGIANVIEIPGEDGENWTGITVGGLEVSQNNYLVAVTQVTQTEDASSYMNNKTPNVYVMIQPQNDLYNQKAKRVALTSYSEGDSTRVKNPFIVKISDNKFLVMWETTYSDENYVYDVYKNGISAVLIDENGNKLTDIKQFNGTLSDCQPVFYNGKVIWYSTGVYDERYTTTTTYYYGDHVETYYSGQIIQSKADSTPTFYEIEVIENGSENTLIFSDNPGDVTKKTDVTQVRNFVTRFYKVVLGRDGEETGINDWTNKLVTKERTGCDVAKGFAMSQEFKNKNLGNEDFLKVMYKGFFDRYPDEGGYNDWLNKLNSGVSREAVIAGFVNSTEFRNLCARYNINPGTMTVSEEGQKITQPQQPAQPQQRPPLKLDASGVDADKLDEYVERLYTEILGRPSEPEGKEYWKKVIIEGKDDNGNIYDAATAARRGFFESTEYKNKGRNDDEFLTDLYHAFFGREPDEAGYADWQNRMKNQGYSRQRVIDEGFGHSQEFKNLLTSYGFKIIE